MSRILRRPMFRGGRVDSRGTGITSGLGYEKGGRVGYRNAGSVMSRGGLGGGRTPFRPPMVINTGRTYSRPIGPPRGGLSGGTLGSRLLSRSMNLPFIGKAMRPLFGGIPSATGFKPMMMKGGLGLFGAGALGGELIGQAADFYARGSSTPEGYARLKEMSGPGFNFDETNIDVGEVFKYIDEGNEIGEKYGFFPRGGPKKRLEEMGLADKYDSSGNRIEEIVEKQITNNDVKNNYKNTFRKVTDDTEESTEISKADIEKNKELFAELLGGGKARGEDISNMLMSFAGKALKPEADVKTAFGEFFEEEAKRPSSKTKVDQAAAQLAINDYIAGKRSKEATKNLLAKLKVQAKLGEADLYENIIKIAGPGSNPTVANLESALKVTEDTRGKPVTRIKKALKEDGTKNYEIEEKDYDSFIITETPKTIIYIDTVGNETQIY
jgi:hypothetical protein